MKLFEIYTNDPEARKIVNSVFPEYKGREVSVEEFSGPMQLPSYWSEGCRDYWAIMNLTNNRSKTIPENGTPFSNQGKIFRISKLPPNFAIIRYHSGKHDSAEIIVNKDNLAKMLPQKTEELPWAEKVVLAATRGLKSSYAGIPNYRFHSANRETGITQAEWDVAKANLIKNRLLNAAGAITTDGRNAIGWGELRNLKKSV